MVLGGVLAGLVLGVLATHGSDDAAKTMSTSTEKLDPLPSALTISLPRTATGRRVPDGFLGFSFEFSAVRAYTGSDPRAINPVFEQLIRNLSPGQDPVLRIGGDSTDVSYAPSPGVTPPPYVAYALTPSWMATTAALAHQLGARMTMGLNLVANDPALAAAEARDYVRAFGRAAIAGAGDRQRAQHLQPPHRRPHAARDSPPCPAAELRLSGVSPPVPRGRPGRAAPEAGRAGTGRGSHPE